MGCLFQNDFEQIATKVEIGTKRIIYKNQDASGQSRKQFQENIQKTKIKTKPKATTTNPKGLQGRREREKGYSGWLLGRESSMSDDYDKNRLYEILKGLIKML